jgi:dienelactone hydrolase
MRSFTAALTLSTAIGCGAATQSGPGPHRIILQSRDATLAATLVLPQAPSRSRSPAAVMVHGSGRVTAAELAGPADRLRRMGLAVVTYDKRGVGASTGEYSTIGPQNSERMFDLLARDALAAVAALKARRDVDPDRIGLVGFSQAGWIAPLAASMSEDIAFLVLVSGPAVSVGEEIAYSRLAGEDPGSEQGLSDEEIERRMRGFRGPHGFEPLPILSELRTPSLWVLGEQDRSIPLRRTVESLTRLKQAGRPISLHVIPGVNHRLRHGVTGAQPDFWPVMADWLRNLRILRQ